MSAIDQVSTHKSSLAHHFSSLRQQTSAGKLGMWIFLAQELLFFSGLFMAYIALRYYYPETFLEAHEKLSTPMGATNTVILLTSSLTMALAVRGAQTGNKKALVNNLIATIVFAFGFLIIKFFEYSSKFEHGYLPGRFYTGEAMSGSPESFFAIYFVMTGTHGIHVIIGIGVLAWILIRAMRNEFTPSNYTAVENVGLYWHLVDLIWIFLFPLLYLVR